MSLERLCERCDRASSSWTVVEARLDVGRLQRKPMLCKPCTDEIELVLRDALRRHGQKEEQTAWATVSRINTTNG